LTLYLDTSVLVSALTIETGTARSQAWLAAQDLRECTVSDWVVTELSAALAMKQRGGYISGTERSAALALFNRLVNESLQVLSVTPVHFRAAARLADQHALGLRGGEALHLAIAAGEGATLCTLDRRLATAAATSGVTTHTL
jgi:predicted nucleic acid-binding protein